MGIEMLINPFNTVVCIHTHTDIHTAQAHAHTRTPTPCLSRLVRVRALCTGS